MSSQGDFKDMNKYQVYRKIRADRAYRTLGKMNAYRVIAGILLLVFVFFFSGAVSQYFAVRGSFKTANALMIAPGWMEKYRPAQKAFIEAGVMYQDGDYDGAYNAFSAIEELDAAAAMKEASAVKIASLALSESDYDKAYGFITSIDPSALPEADMQEYRNVCGVLLDHFAGSSDPGSSLRTQAMEDLLGAVSPEPK